DTWATCRPGPRLAEWPHVFWLFPNGARGAVTSKDDDATPAASRSLPGSLPGPPSPADATRTSERSEDSDAPVAEATAIPRQRDPERYRILGEHGRGGLGRVSRAHDVELGRDVAIKELIARGHVSEVRFLREAIITARLEHPGIVPVHEAG